MLFPFFHNSLIIHGIIHQIVFGYFDLYFLLFIRIKYDMKTAQNIVNNSIKENRLPLKVSSLRSHRRYLGITHLCENAHFTFKILQYTCFNCTCYTCSYDECVWDISQSNKICKISHIACTLPFLDCFGWLVSPSGHRCMVNAGARKGKPIISEVTSCVNNIIYRRYIWSVSLSFSPMDWHNKQITHLVTNYWP